MDKKITRWARIGQLAYWGYNIFYTLNMRADPSYVANTVTDIEALTAFVGVVCGFFVTEAVVRIISEFAKMMNNKK